MIERSHDAPHNVLSLADGRNDLFVQYITKKYRDLGSGAGIWDHLPRDLILKEANCLFMNDTGQGFKYTDPNFVSQMLVCMAPGLDAGLMVETIGKKLASHNLPRPLN